VLAVGERHIAIKSRVSGRQAETQPRVELRFAELDGRLACVSLEIGAQVVSDELVLEEGEELEQLTTARLRQVRLTSFIDSYLLALASMADEHADRNPTIPPSADAVLMSASRPKRPGRPPLYTNEHYRNVLNTYNNFGGRAKRQAVAEAFKLPASTASKHIAEAKRRERLGMLGKDDETKEDV
jgi:hypothetical protein